MNSETNTPVVLLVEDNADDVFFVREALSRSHWNVELAHSPDGEDALARLKNQGSHANAPKPSLVLLDINMPKKNGRELLKEIKEDSKLRRIPVVMLTTSSSKIDILACASLHANAYITKPVEYEEFVNVLNTTLDFWLSCTQQA